MLKRRLFLSALAVSATSAMMPAAVLAATRESSDLIDDGPLAHKFAALVGSDFQFRDAAGASSRGRLVAFDEGPDYPGLEQFSVVFEGDALAEGLFDIHHARTGRLTVSCMPATGAAPGSCRQRAYFSCFC